ncbi:hypothetical protein ElyMa_002482800 [Elysia marginata]|uniref:Galectin n=1 Tax=Elysia marginata TaxID=1093978 RepID=A0AAV4GMP2_9GAST|nr:hypothetical protein ElyMa_002482800 [Elysia marginata]
MTPDCYSMNGIPLRPDHLIPILISYGGERVRLAVNGHDIFPVGFISRIRIQYLSVVWISKGPVQLLWLLQRDLWAGYQKVCYVVFRRIRHPHFCHQAFSIDWTCRQRARASWRNFELANCVFFWPDEVVRAQSDQNGFCGSVAD